MNHEFNPPFAKLVLLPFGSVLLGFVTLVYLYDVITNHRVLSWFADHMVGGVMIFYYATKSAFGS
jgi:hypothetical protein